jgi:hypothetical protein
MGRSVDYLQLPGHRTSMLRFVENLLLFMTYATPPTRVSWLDICLLASLWIMPQPPRKRDRLSGAVQHSEVIQTKPATTHHVTARHQSQVGGADLPITSSALSENRTVACYILVL